MISIIFYLDAMGEELPQLVIISQVLLLWSLLAIEESGTQYQIVEN